MATPENRPDPRQELWRVSTLGIELTGAIVGLALVGYLIDLAAGSSPVGLLVGLTMGLIGGGYNFIRKASAMSRAEASHFRRTHARPAVPSRAARNDAAQKPQPGSDDDR